VRTRAALGGFALAASAGWSLANIGAVADRISLAYGVGLAVVGLFTTALVLTHAAMQLPAGRLCDRYGPRLVGAAGLVVILAASLAGLARPDPWLAVVVRLISGIGLAAAFVGGVDYIRATLGTPVAQGLYGAASMASAGAALALVPLLAGWRAPWESAALVAAVGLVVVAVAPREQREVSAAVRVRVFDRRLTPLCVAHAASFGISVVLGNWVATLLERDGGQSAEVAGFVAGLVLFLGVFSRPLGGRLIGRPSVIRASFLVAAAGIGLLVLTRPLPVAVAGATLLGLAAGVPFASAFAGAQRLRPDAPAAAVALVNLAAILVILVGTPLVGLTFSLPGGGRIGFAIAGGLCVAATFSVRNLHRVHASR
jgi:MFS family permease